MKYRPPPDPGRTSTSAAAASCSGSSLRRRYPAMQSCAELFSSPQLLGAVGSRAQAASLCSHAGWAWQADMVRAHLAFVFPQNASSCEREASDSRLIEIREDDNGFIMGSICLY